MKQVLSVALLLVFGIGASGCYHANIMTGKEPSSKTVEKKWFVGFVNGLVITEDLDVANECLDGVAQVETKLSFANQLVTFLTGGIFSPMTIIVTCAAGPNTADVIQGTDEREVLELAARSSRDADAPVYVQMSGIE